MRDGDRKCVGMFILYFFKVLDSNSRTYNLNQNYIVRTEIKLVRGNHLHTTKMQEKLHMLELYAGELLEEELCQ